MANFITDLGNALETAFKANTDLRVCFPDPAGGSAYAIEYDAQRLTFRPDIPSAFIRTNGRPRPIESYEGSARSVFPFEAWFQVHDEKSKNSRLAQCLQGLANVFTDNGVAILDTHLTDNGSNRLNKSGEVRAEIDVDPLEVVDPDRPIVRATIEIECTHKTPLQ